MSPAGFRCRRRSSPDASAHPLSELRGSITDRQRIYLAQLLRQRHPTDRPSWIDSAHLERLSARDAHRAITELVSPPPAPEAPCSCGATAPEWAHRPGCETMAATRRRVAERRAALTQEENR